MCMDETSAIPSRMWLRLTMSATRPVMSSNSTRSCVVTLKLTPGTSGVAATMGGGPSAVCVISGPARPSHMRPLGEVEC